jgi:hypothetical protein
MRPNARSRRAGKFGAWPIAAAAAVGLALAGGAWYLLRDRAPPPAEPAIGRRVADAFLAQLRAGQFDAAWQSTTAEFKSDEGRESFARYVRSNPLLRQPLEFVTYEVSDLNGLARGQCRYSPPAGSKTGGKQVRLVIAQELGEWKVEGVFVE